MAQRQLASTYPEYFPLDDIYYTLDLDYEDWELEKNKKKQNKTKKEAKRNSTPQEDDAKKKKGSSSSSRELRSLLPDVRPKKRGTATYLYEGQEELCESLDSVLTKIKDYSEHSYPFLNKVRMSDAPDYYEVIKKPMDLGLMTKKLKRGDYSSKSEFQADLNLIYANCRIYNTDPSSRIYLDHAECLEKRSKELMKPVKNIDFSRERKIRESANPNISPSATPNRDEEEHTTPKTTLQSSTDSAANTPPIKSRQKSPDKDKEKFNASPMSPIKIEIPDFDSEAVQSKTDLYRCLTRQYRLQKMTHLHEQDKLPFGDRAALVRDPNNMRKFMALSGYPGLSKKASDQPTTAQTTTTLPTTNTEEPPDPPTPTITSTTTTTTSQSTSSENGDKAEKGDKGEKGGEEGEGAGAEETPEDLVTRDVGFFPELCFFVDSVPELHPCISSDDEAEEEGGGEGESVSGDIEPMAVDEVGGVVIKKEKEEIQDEDERPRATKPNTPPTPSSASTSLPTSPIITNTQTEPPISTTPLQIPSILPRAQLAPLHCVDYYNALLRRTIALVLSKSGFVTIGSSQVMDVLTDVVNGYMLRLGRILKTHMDDVGGEVPMEEVFSRVLCEMGIAGLADIREFVLNLSNPPDADMGDLDYDSSNSLYNRSVGMEYDYDEDGYHDGDPSNEFSEEELVSGTVMPESTGRQKRQVTKISARDNMYEYYEEEAPNAELVGEAVPAYAQPSNSSKIAKPKKVVQKKGSVKPQPNQKKRTKNLPQNAGVNKKKKQ